MGYIHYFPKYFHLHIHFKSNICETNRIYRLKDVINELKRDSNYYKKAKLNTQCQSRKIAEALTDYTNKQTKSLPITQYKIESTGNAKFYLKSNSLAVGYIKILFDNMRHV